ncbi:MAG: hypothetical protein HOY71_56250, partial [Nonomuraea sp.]|nr:hypothetical protein [Nonomuraea sp.]
LGAAGAVLVADQGLWYGTCRVDDPRSSVGAGDALLAGFLAALSRPTPDDPAHTDPAHAGPEPRTPAHGGLGYGGPSAVPSSHSDHSPLAGVGAAGLEGALVEGLAWAAAAVGLPGSRMPYPRDIRRDLVRLCPLDPSTPLGG